MNKDNRQELYKLWIGSIPIKHKIKQMNLWRSEDSYYV